MQMARTLRLLRWLYIGRLTIAAGIFAAALWAWSGVPADVTLVATLVLLLSIGVTVAAFWYTDVLGHRPGRTFLYAQLVFDAVLVTAIVHITTVSNTPSDFSPLYILVIAAAALVLPLPGGFLVGGLATVLYLADLVWLQPFTLSLAWLLQAGLFVLIAAATALLGHRLRRNEAALGEAQSELRQLRLDTNDVLASIDTGLVTVDGDGRLMHMNAAAEEILLLKQAEWHGRPVLDALDRQAPSMSAVIARTGRTRTPVRRHQIRVDRAQGQVFLHVRTTVLEHPDRPWVTAVIQDVTEQQEIDDLIRRAERLQAVAELGASLAHEIKNPLAAIRSSIEQLAGNRLREDDRQTLHRLVISESDRLSRLLVEFMEFSRLELRRWRSLDLGEIATEAIGLVAQHPDTGAGTVIEFVPPSEPVTVQGDQDLLHRAVFNLVLNGVQHAGPTGRVRVEIGRADSLENGAAPAIEAPVRLTVQDSGPGIREEDVGRLFDPFYTTRNGGNGLGLAMVHRAIEAHRGAIMVDGNDGAGARFTVYLPTRECGRRN
jgi:two-component system sensor histidine kinase PilS (NtrC family)